MGMENVGSVWETIQNLVIAVTPLAVGILSYLSVKKDKEDKEYRELRESYEEVLNKEKKEKDEKIEENIQKITEDVKNLSSKINDIDVEDINTQLKNLVSISEINLQYSQSLSKVVTTIGECLRDSNIEFDNDISKVISEHQELERNITNRLYKVLY